MQKLFYGAFYPISIQKEPDNTLFPHKIRVESPFKMICNIFVIHLTLSALPSIPTSSLGTLRFQPLAYELHLYPPKIELQSGIYL